MTSDQDKGLIAWLRQLYDDRPIVFALGLMTLSTMLIIVGWGLVAASGLG